MAVGARAEIDEFVPYLAGLVGQAALDRLADGAHPDLDQHMAAVTEAAKDVLGRRHTDPAHLLGFLVRYATGFLSAATAGGWRPAADAPSPCAAGPSGSAQLPDWESMRLAAVCRLVAEHTATAPPDTRAPT
ncbi:MAG TPA: DUF6401 family natural product biosynthesis protein [Streptosporangiaceae bacterium]|nr:DUF6401 family natural product biosynthesis protein [Streptosporangiaceae bacterium]